MYLAWLAVPEWWIFYKMATLIIKIINNISFLTQPFSLEIMSVNTAILDVSNMLWVPLDANIKYYNKL